MKYIKTFEIVFNDIKLSKYLLTQKPNNTDIYFVLEVSPEQLKFAGYEDIINTKKLYTYTKSKNYLKKGKHQHFNITKNELDKINIVYQSDNLQNVKDVLPTLNYMDKYNI